MMTKKKFDALATEARRARRSYEEAVHAERTAKAKEMVEWQKMQAANAALREAAETMRQGR